MMTKVGQLFEEEKIEAVKKATKDAEIKTAKKLMLKGYPLEDIFEITETLTMMELRQLAKEVEK